MHNAGFHNQPYDPGTLTKLKIFELYAQAWIPVFVAQPEPRFGEIHIFDFFCGPGNDSEGAYGSPLRIMDQLRRYERSQMAGWTKVRIVAHFFDADANKVAALSELLAAPEWQVPGVKTDLRALPFKDALQAHKGILEDRNAAKLLVIDQFGVNEVTDDVFKLLIGFPRTDFIFFVSSSILNRFHDHPAIKIKIEKPDDSYHVHRKAFDYFKNLIPETKRVFLRPFSILKRGNIYGLIFGSQHPRGIHKFLEVAWANDEIRGEANFDIGRENIASGEMLLPLEELRPQKIQEFERELEANLRAGVLVSETDVIRFCIQAGMTGKHSSPVLKKLKDQGVIKCDFRSPRVENFNRPRPIFLA